ncbi:MAG: dolichyl-phosphate beta-glucosyltransferase [Patescibacteria group bacterium]|nr:dolichyl-phosphate beta-glucosyltransferase [Patescibacteria group bacterium]
MHLSVIIPAYNEEKNLKNTILKCLEYLNKQKYLFEIIIVNDGSTDSTLQIAQKLSSKYNVIKIIDLKINQGKGAAVKTGILASLGGYSLFMDADYATSIDNLDKAWVELKNCNVVIASRNPKDVIETKIEISQSVWKQSLGKIGNFLTRALTGLSFYDTQCGFKIFTSTVAKKIFTELKTVGWAFDIEALLLAQKYNYKIKAIPVIWKNAPDSRVGFKGYLTTLKELISIKINL